MARKTVRNVTLTNTSRYPPRSRLNNYRRHTTVESPCTKIAQGLDDSRAQSSEHARLPGGVSPGVADNPLECAVLAAVHVEHPQLTLQHAVLLAEDHGEVAVLPLLELEVAVAAVPSLRPGL